MTQDRGKGCVHANGSHTNTPIILPELATPPPMTSSACCPPPPATTAAAAPPLPPSGTSDRDGMLRKVSGGVGVRAGLSCYAVGTKTARKGACGRGLHLIRISVQQPRVCTRAAVAAKAPKDQIHAAPAAVGRGLHAHSRGRMPCCGVPQVRRG